MFHSVTYRGTDPAGAVRSRVMTVVASPTATPSWVSTNLRREGSKTDLLPCQLQFLDHQGAVRNVASARTAQGLLSSLFTLSLNVADAVPAPSGNDPTSSGWRDITKSRLGHRPPQQPAATCSANLTSTPPTPRRRWRAQAFCTADRAPESMRLNIARFEQATASTTTRPPFSQHSPRHLGHDPRGPVSRPRSAPGSGPVGSGNTRTETGRKAATTKISDPRRRGRRPRRRQAGLRRGCARRSEP
jgi:hypothetical protein